MKKNLLFLFLLFFSASMFAQTLTIAEAREDLNNDQIPDRLGDTLTVTGVAISPNYQTTNRSYYIWDGTAGITTFKSGLLSPALDLGDEVELTGYIDHFNGLTEIVPLTDTSIIVISTGNALPDPIELTIGQYFADPETYEASLVAFVNLSKVSGTWPASGSVTLMFSDGVDTVDIRIDSDTDIDGNSEPAYPVDIIGLGSQFTTYQILPRFYTDFLPGGTLPVELVSFNASVSGNNVVLNWSTATETNNSGFEVQKSSDNKNFKKAGFIAGHGTTSEKSSYNFIDENVESGKYYYRLKQIDFDGSVEYSSSVNVDVNAITSYGLAQNYPNPFNPSTKINFALPVEAKVSVRIFNLLGKEVANILNDNLAAGEYNYTANLSSLSSGVYFYSIEAFGVDGSKFTSTKKMTLMK